MTSVYETNGRLLAVGDLCFMARSYNNVTIGTITGFKVGSEVRVSYRQIGETKDRTILPKKILSLEPFWDLKMEPGVDEKNIKQRKDISGKLLRRGHIVATVSRLMRTNVRLMMIKDFGPRGGALQRPLSKAEYLAIAPKLYQKRRLIDESDTYAGDVVLVINDSLKESLFRMKLTR